MTPAADAPVARYNELLTSRHAASTRAHLARETEARTLYFMKRPIVGMLRPFFLTQATYQGAMDAALGVSRALSATSDRLAREPWLRREIGLSEEEETLIALEPHGLEELCGRMDGFIGQDGVARFIEYNSMGAGTAQSEELSQTFWGMPVMEELRATCDVRFLRMHDHVARTIIDFFYARGGSGAPRLVVVSASSSTCDRDLPESAMIAPTLARWGIELASARPEELDVRRDGVFVRGARADVLLVDFWPEFLRVVPPAHAFWGAVRARTVHLAKSIRAQVLRGDKRAFALLSDPDHLARLDRETRALVARHVPWSRVVRATRTAFEGREHDLPELVAKHRERFVLKPSDAYGGAGVCLGWEESDGSWRRALDEALARGTHVVQERVTAPREPFPMVVDGEVRVEDAFVDFSPFVWREREAKGAQVRVSRSSMMNLCAGVGSCVPMYIVGPS